MLERSNGNKERLSNIDTFLKKSKKEGLSDEEKEQLYSLVRYTPVDILSTEKLEELKQLDEEKFKETFKGKKVIKNVGKDSLGAIYFSAAKLFVKGVYALPKMIISKKARDEYMPKIKKHIASGSKRLANLTQSNEKEDNNSAKAQKPKFRFPNIFRKNEQKKLEAGGLVNPENSDITSQVPTDKVATNQQSFEEYCKVDNQNGQVEKKATEAAARNVNTNGDKVKSNTAVEEQSGEVK